MPFRGYIFALSVAAIDLLNSALQTLVLVLKILKSLPLFCNHICLSISSNTFRFPLELL